MLLCHMFARGMEVSVRGRAHARTHKHTHTEDFPLCGTSLYVNLKFFFSRIKRWSSTCKSESHTPHTLNKTCKKKKSKKLASVHWYPSRIGVTTVCVFYVLNHFNILFSLTPLTQFAAPHSAVSFEGAITVAIRMRATRFYVRTSEHIL